MIQQEAFYVKIYQAGKELDFVRCGKFRFYHADLHHHSYLLPFAGRTGRFRFYRFWNLGTDNFCRCLNSGSTFPFLGALADYKGMKKKMFSLFLVVGVIGLLLLSFSGNWISYMILFVITRIGYSACNIFYDSMLVDVTADDRMDRISSYGYALGYIGSCIPFIIGILLILVRPFGLSTQAATQISFVITALWWVGLTIPLLKNVHQTHYLENRANQVSHALSRIGQTLKKIRKNPSVLYFIIAYFCYIDGVYTIISMGNHLRR